MGLGPGRFGLPRRRRTVQRRHLRLGNRLARVDGDPVVVAARQRLEQHQAVPGRDARCVRRHGPHAQPALLRSRARAGRARHRRPGRLRRLHVPRRRHRLGVPVGRLSDRRRVHAVLQPRLPRRRRLRPSGPRHAHAPDAADHVEAARRATELLRDRLARTRTSRTSPTTRSRRFPPYSPRSQLRPTTYSDETTLYYWAVLPATGLNGSGAVGDPLSAAASTFQKQSLPPSQMSPADGALLTDQPVFRWASVEGARRYRFQVAQEPTFANPIEDVLTASTSYTPLTTYPADTTLYWRVRADDENLIGLTWSSVRTFQRKLPDADDRSREPDDRRLHAGVALVERDRCLRLHVRDRRTGRRATTSTPGSGCAQPRSSTSSGRASGAGACAPSSRSCRRASSPARGRRTCPSRGR